ncbi:hypothetical protein AB0E88_26120 [Streptomyces sp. NPDC028635]|uniref:hypothetical protein n=1 Tax=Streptomyces sp. NPDC028635 TaxID=3154800 RepID=UPI003407E94D
MKDAEILALPFVDEHSVLVAAEPDAVWRGLGEVLEGSGGRWGRVVRLLGCADRAASGPRPPAQGATLRGFRVAVADPGRELTLVGRHRFASYALIFRLEAVASGHTRVRAVTRARFPGPAGSVYRRLVIGSGAHALVVRRMLSAVGERAPKGARGTARPATT